jgi:hypothetical protein
LVGSAAGGCAGAQAVRARANTRDSNAINLNQGLIFFFLQKN